MLEKVLNHFLKPASIRATGLVGNGQQGRQFRVSQFLHFADATIAGIGQPENGQLDYYPRAS
jgi:hypothetical protein